MLQVIHEELMAVFVAGVAESLHRLIREQALLVAEAAEFQLVRPDVLREIACGNARRPGLEHQHADSALGEFFRDPSATSTGTDDQNFVDVARSEHEAASLAEYLWIYGRP
jgi:hypothetical protein